MAVPYGVPVILQSVQTELNLQNPPGSRKARCLVENRDVYEQMILHPLGDNKVAIQSVHSERFLQVSTTGKCVFEPRSDAQWEFFTMRNDTDGNLNFYSCHTGTRLEYDDNGVVKCPSESHCSLGAWRIVEPRASDKFSCLVSNHRYVLAGTERQNFILELAKCGKTPREIEQIVTRMFDVPAAIQTLSQSSVHEVVKK